MDLNLYALEHRCNGQKTKIMEIVEPASAILPHPNERPVSSAATHRDICRFENPRDVRFLDVWRQIEQCIDKIIKEVSSAYHSEIQDHLEASSQGL